MACVTGPQGQTPNDDERSEGLPFNEDDAAQLPSSDSPETQGTGLPFPLASVNLEVGSLSTGSVSNGEHGLVILSPPHQLVGKIPTPKRKIELAELGWAGVLKLRDQFADTMEDSVGAEVETSVTARDSGRPAHELGRTILDALQASPTPEVANTSKGELMAHQIEENTRPFVFPFDDFAVIEKYRRNYNAEERQVASEFHCEILHTGILPTIAPQDMELRSLNAARRYAYLIRAIEEMANRPGQEPFFSRLIEGPDGKDTHLRYHRNEHGERQVQVVHPDGVFTLRNPSIFLESVMTSNQIHVAVPDQSQYKGYHRVADWLTPAIISLTASSPLLFMEQTGFMESRNGFIWDVSTHPDRCGLMSDTWIDDFEYVDVDGRPKKLDARLYQMAYAQKHIEALLDPRDGGGKLRDGTDLDRQIVAAEEQYKTTWPLNRTTYTENEAGKLRAHIEVRSPSAGPTITDEMAHMVFVKGVIPAVYKKYADAGIPLDQAHAIELNQSLDFEDLKSNVDKSCAYALDANFKWVHGENKNARELLLTELLPASKDELYNARVEQLGEKGYKGRSLKRALHQYEEQLNHYFDVLQDRLTFDWSHIPDAPENWKTEKIGCTPADVILYLDYKFKSQGIYDRPTRASKLVEALHDADRFDRVTYEKTGKGCGIVGWLMAVHGNPLH